MLSAMRTSARDVMCRGTFDVHSAGTAGAMSIKLSHVGKQYFFLEGKRTSTQHMHLKSLPA